MRTRFAPSPTGLLHLGHAWSATVAARLAEEESGTFLLRIEDTDSTRCRPQFEDAIYEDLTWLGLTWPEPVRRQSDHRDDLLSAVDPLAERGLIYPCSCTRRDVIDAGATLGVEGYVYPGTCRARPMSDRRPGDALRLDLRRALTGAPPLTFTETGPIHAGLHTVDPTALIEGQGDPVLIRKETGDPAYHLAVVHDDAVQQITDVVRGADLWFATPLHRLLQNLLGRPTPTYHHHALVLDQAGKRLSKTDASRAIRSYREAGYSADEVIGLACAGTSAPSFTAV